MSKKPIERRLNSEPIQIRSNPDGSIGVRGYAAVFDSEAHGEVIRSSAFNRTVEQNDNFRLLVNHEGVPLASVRAGTLQVGVDEHGLWFDAPSLDMANPRVQELVSAMKRGDINQCSFAGYFTDVRNTRGIDEVYEVRGTDVSIVTYPWYEDTEAGLTGVRDVDRALLVMRSLSPEQREMTIVALGDLTIAAPVADSSVDSSVETEMSSDCVPCPVCGADVPADANFCPTCGAAMRSDEPTETREAEPAEEATAPRGRTTAEARALLGLLPVA